MRLKALFSSISLACVLAIPLAIGASAQATLSGQVSSAEEGLMEGVLVSAKKDGSSVTTTVVSNDKGQYSFPAGKLEPGRYTISIRAAGYNLVGPKAVDVAAGAPATADVKLTKTRNLRQPALQCGMADQRPGRRQDQVVPAGLRRLPHVAARVHLAARRRRMEAGVHPHGPLCAGIDADASAAAGLGGARSERPRVAANMMQAAADFLVGVNLSNRGPRGIRPQDPAASEGPRHQGRDHRIRPAAQGGDAARRRGRCRRARLVFRLRQPDGGRARSQDRQGDGLSAAAVARGAAEGLARPRARSRRQSLDRHVLPGRRFQDRPQDQGGHRLSAAQGMAEPHHADQHGDADAYERRRQGRG